MSHEGFLWIPLSLLMTKPPSSQAVAILNMSGTESDVGSVFFSASDEEQGSFDSFLRTPEEISSPLGQDSDTMDNGLISSGGSHDRIPAQDSMPMSSACAFESSSSSHASAASVRQKHQVSRPTASRSQAMSGPTEIRHEEAPIS